MFMQIIEKGTAFDQFAYTIMQSGEEYIIIISHLSIFLSPSPNPLIIRGDERMLDSFRKTSPEEIVYRLIKDGYDLGYGLKGNA